MRMFMIALASVLLFGCAAAAPAKAPRLTAKDNSWLKNEQAIKIKATLDKLPKVSPTLRAADENPAGVWVVERTVDKDGWDTVTHSNSKLKAAISFRVSNEADPEKLVQARCAYFEKIAVGRSLQYGTEQTLDRTACTGFITEDGSEFFRVTITAYVVRQFNATVVLVYTPLDTHKLALAYLRDFLKRHPDEHGLEKKEGQ